MKPKTNFVLRAFLFQFAFMFLMGFAQAQPNQQVALTSPYDCIYNHLYFLQPDSYQPSESAKSLPPGLDAKTSESLAIQLKQILDGKGLGVELDLLPQNANYKDSTSQRSVYVLFPDEMPGIYLEKQGSQWFYSVATLRNIRQIHQEVYPFGSDIFIQMFPKIGQYRILGIFLWQWFGLVFLLLGGWIFFWLAKWLLNFLVKRLTNLRLGKRFVRDDLLSKIGHFGALIILTKLWMFFLPILHFPVGISKWMMKSLEVLMVFFILFLSLKILDYILAYLSDLAVGTENKMDDQILPLIKRLLQLLFIVFGLLKVLSLLDVNITALIAGVSIGGLALALAAQDTVRNFIGSVLVFMDRPFQIGDYISFSGAAGVVEEVGFRSTRLRTPDQSVISVPNGKLMDAIVDNLGMRKYRRFKQDMEIEFGASQSDIEAFVLGLRQMLAEHPATIKDNFQVSLKAMGASGLVIHFMTYLELENYQKELDARQDIIFGILKIAEENNISFAYPSQTLFVKK